MPTHNLTSFRWTDRRETAAQLLAKDDLTNIQIAEQVGVTRAAIDIWNRHPAFQARIREHRDRWARELSDLGLADRRNRIAAKNERWLKLQQVIRERAADPSIAHLPGASTGLVTRTWKVIGKGDDLRIVEEHAVDTGTLSALNELEMSAAKDLGQLDDKREQAIQQIVLIAQTMQFSPKEILEFAPNLPPSARALVPEVLSRIAG